MLKQADPYIDTIHVGVAPQYSCCIAYPFILVHVLNVIYMCACRFSLFDVAPVVLRPI